MTTAIQTHAALNLDCDTLDTIWERERATGDLDVLEGVPDDAEIDSEAVAATVGGIEVGRTPKGLIVYATDTELIVVGDAHGPVAARVSLAEVDAPEAGYLIWC